MVKSFHYAKPNQTNMIFTRQLVKANLAYKISVLNISGTSFGALSPPAIQSLSAGAKLGGFAHNTGEGAFSKYHEAGGGDTIWQISTGTLVAANLTVNLIPMSSRRSLVKIK